MDGERIVGVDVCLFGVEWFGFEWRWLVMDKKSVVKRLEGMVSELKKERVDMNVVVGSEIEVGGKIGKVDSLFCYGSEGFVEDGWLVVKWEDGSSEDVKWEGGKWKVCEESVEVDDKVMGYVWGEDRR